MSLSRFRLADEVGNGRVNRPGDVLGVKRALRALGRYDRPEHEFIDQQTTDALKRFQGERGLRVDGWLAPDGETHRNLARDLAGGSRLPALDRFALRGEVGEGRGNAESDVAMAKKAFARLGRYTYDTTGEPLPFIDEGLSKAITRFQRDSGLKADGWMAPGGETEWALLRTPGLLSTRARPGARVDLLGREAEPGIADMFMREEDRGKFRWRDRLHREGEHPPLSIHLLTQEAAAPNRADGVRGSFLNGTAFQDHGAELFTLGEAVGRGAPNGPEDIAKLQIVLHAAGGYDPGPNGPSGRYDDGLAEAIRETQASRGLTRDGLVNPWGETMQALTEDIASRASSATRYAADGQAGSSDPSTQADAPAEGRPSESPGKRPPSQRDLYPDTGIAEQPPEHKNRIIGRQDWAPFRNAMQSQSQVLDPAQNALARLYGEEGGSRADSRGTAAGLQQSTLSDLIARGRLRGVPADARPSDLTHAQIAAAYKAYFDDVLGTVGGTNALANIQNAQTRAAFADTLFWQGRGRGTELMQRAANDVIDRLPEADRSRLGRVAVDGRMGPATMDTIRRIERAGLGDAWRDRLADRRLSGVTLQGEKDRIERLR